VIRAIAAAGCLFAAILVALESWAEVLAHRDTPKGLEAAVRIQAKLGIPQSSVLERLAERRRWDLHDRDVTFLREAVRVNPRSTSARIRLGLAQESAGEHAAAERSLLEAARFDRQHLPAWTAANYYFRRDRHEEFWAWASLAAERTYDDFRPLLRLMDTVQAHPAAVLARIHAGRNQQALERAYMRYLVAERRLDDAEWIAARLAAEPFNRASIADLVDRDLHAGRIANALQLWNRIDSNLDPLRDRILTNGDFETRPSGVAFDWHLRSCEGATSRWSPRRVEFEFTGAQPDHCVLLEQTIPIAPGHHYTAIIDSAPRMLTGQLDGVSLRIVLSRTSGTVPFQGSVVIRSIRLQPY
jgi:tetratricopeptide (TPR) repeat protein